MGGLQAQYAPSMYIGLWSRTEGLQRDALTRALERRTVIQGTLLRSTIHLVSRRDWWPFAVAVREARRAWWLRTRRGAVSEAEMERAAARLRERLGDDPMPRKAIVEVVGQGALRGDRPVGRPRPRAAVGDVGAPQGGSVRRRGALGRAVRCAEGGLGRAARASLPRRVRAGDRRRVRRLGRASAGGRASGRRARRDAALPGRGRRRAPRPAACAAARPGCAGAGPVPADLGRDPARARPAGAHHPGGRPDPASSRRRPRSRSRPSSSTARSRGPGVTRTGASRSRRSGVSTPPTAAPSRTRASGSRPSTPSGPPPSARRAAARAGPRCAAAQRAVAPRRRPPVVRSAGRPRAPARRCRARPDAPRRARRGRRGRTARE